MLPVPPLRAIRTVFPRFIPAPSSYRLTLAPCSRRHRSSAPGAGLSIFSAPPLPANDRDERPVGAS